jgi:hypothetical protein
MNIQNKIINNIINIYENHNEIEIKNIKLEFSINKYSSTKKNIWHIILNNKILSKKDKYLFKYKCITCNAINIITVISFLRKINKCSFCCLLCNNKDINKRKKQSEFMKNINKVEKKIITEKTNLSSIQNIINESINLFNALDNDFKTKYFLYHLTEDDYKRISKNIKSFQNGKYTDLNSIKYIPIFKTNNQMKFTSIMYDTKNDILFKAHQPILNCDNCNNNWRSKLLERFKNSIKIMCKNCSLVNKTFKIRNTKNVNNDTILYQSKLELKFIDWCNNNNILVKNGPNIQYNFADKNRIYRVDFQINKTLIEIKDDHIWHKNAVLSGNWKAREMSINKLIECKEYDNYFLIFPRNWDYYLNKLNKI